MTVGGGVSHPGVIEIAMGTSVGEVAASAGTADGIGAVLLGGYFGGWLRAHEAWDLSLDPVTLRASGSAFGCGVVYLLPPDACGVLATARILDYMAGQSAAQCGPCVFGLRSIADAAARLAIPRSGDGHDLERLVRWSGQLAGRGACKHPDGAAGLLHSGLRVFADEFDHHERAGRCTSPSDVGERHDAGPTVTTLAVDRIVCDGYGICAELLPELIDLDDWGYPIVSAEPVQPSPTRPRTAGRRHVPGPRPLAPLRSGPSCRTGAASGSPARLAGADRSIRRPRPGSQTPAPGRGSGARRERTWRRP